MSDCEHKFTMLDNWGGLVCRVCGIAETVYLRTRAEAAENERDELKHKLQSETTNLILRTTQLDELQLAHSNLLAENERLKTENLAMRCCGNCAYRNGHADCDCDLDNDDTIECYSENYKNWKSKAVKND